MRCQIARTRLIPLNETKAGRMTVELDYFSPGLVYPLCVVDVSARGCHHDLPAGVDYGLHCLLNYWVQVNIWGLQGKCLLNIWIIFIFCQESEELESIEPLIPEPVGRTSYNLGQYPQYYPPHTPAQGPPAQQPTAPPQATPPENLQQFYPTLPVTWGDHQLTFHPHSIH